MPSECSSGENCITNIPEQNLLRIALNENQDIMIEDKIVTLDDIQDLVKLFVNNNGTAKCNYCDGKHFIEHSDHPKNAVISLSHDALTKYDLFISVEDEITKAFYGLRVRCTKTYYNKKQNQLTNDELIAVKQAYPFVVSEFMIKHSN